MALLVSSPMESCQEQLCREELLALLGATGYKSHAAFTEHPLLQKSSWASPAPCWSLDCHWLRAQMSSATHRSPN